MVRISENTIGKTRQRRDTPIVLAMFYMTNEVQNAFEIFVQREQNEDETNVQ